MTTTFSSPEAVMCRALELASLGVGAVEPNPPVGAVVVDDSLRLLGEGYHVRFGGPHAEVNALCAAGDLARGAQLFVTLEPCNHRGQTPPCCDAVLKAGVTRVLVATEDPARHDDETGISRLRAEGVDVETGLLAKEAQVLIAPFSKLVTNGRPFVHAKWAMSLDGRIATRTGDSQWISGEESRAVVHQLRGRMDAIIVGIGTALADDPRLTARPAGPRTATRIVLDSRARLPLDSQLVTTALDVPVIVYCGSEASPEAVNRLKQAGVEVVRTNDPPARQPQWGAILDDLGHRRMTNVLVEGGSEVLGTCLDAKMVDWVHVFVGAKILGGRDSLAAIGGEGVARIVDAFTLDSANFLELGKDAYIEGPLRRVTA